MLVAHEVDQKRPAPHRLPALAFDYDGTLARRGRIAPATLRALERCVARGHPLLLVTGRTLADLCRIGAPLEMFVRVVAENGAVLFDPATGRKRLLADPPDPALVAALHAAGVEPLSAGDVVVATLATQQAQAMATLAAFGSGTVPICNRGSLMLLPAAVDKATGLAAALAELGIDPCEVWAAGDAENDLCFLRACSVGYAVGNALPSVKRAAHVTLAGHDGEGIVQLVDLLLRPPGARPPAELRVGA